MKDIAQQVISSKRNRRALTLRQQAFVREMVKDPSNATQAALRAGYAAKSAHVMASRLLDKESVKSVLAQHFLDKEEMLSDTLGETLVRLRSIMRGAKNETSIRAAKTILHYTKIATDVLGLRVKETDKRRADAPEMLSGEELIREHEKEIERIRAILANAGHPADAEGSAPAVSAGTVH